jgi:hypothetical protein
MKNANSKLTLLLFGGLLFGGMSVVTTSCSDDSDDNGPTVNADKTKLSALIDSTTSVHNAAVEGTKPGNFATGSKATFKTAIDAGTATKNNAAATQTVVNTAESALRRAAKEFESKRIQEVSVANLMAHWKFEGNANDATANGNNGTPKAGYINTPNSTPVTKQLGTAVPTLTADRFGRPNQAYAFNNGAYIEVPYKLALNPQAITISAWVKRDGTNPDNYIVSLDRWKGYKFQLQSADKPFLTVGVGTGSIDHDAEAGVVGTDWTHVVSSYANGTMKFYVNGVMVKEWTGLGNGGTLRAIPEPTPLAIGQQLPNSFYDKAISGGQTTTDPSGATIPDTDYYKFYGAGFFIGSMDDIRIYNKALSDAEVTSIYAAESTL